MPKKTDEAKKPEQVTEAGLPTAKVTPEVPHDIPSTKKMKDLNKELAKAKPTEPGLTGYLRARVKAGK